MAKRKAATSTKRAAKKAVKKPRKAAPKKAAKKKAAARKPARKASAVKKKAVVKKKAAARAAAARARRKAPKQLPKKAPVKARTVKRKVAARKEPAYKPVARKEPAYKAVAQPERKAPSLNRARRVVLDDDNVVLSPPSTLDPERGGASAARSGGRALHERLEHHNETDPGLTGGDIDADWESAYSIGDEAPGGDNPTPDQDIVDDIGRALGNEYNDNEPLKGADKIAQRDKHRWELDPGSKEDFGDDDL